MPRCALCPGIHHCVPASGPAIPEQPLFIGEAPGVEEDKHNQVFYGKTGKEVNLTYLPAAHLRRPDCRFTNAISCLPNTPGHKLDSKNAACLDLLDSCTRANLYPEIERLKPSVLVPMGAFACRAIDPEISLEMHHGIPIQTDRGVAFPMYHPAQGMYDHKLMTKLRTDWIRLGEYLKGTLLTPVDQYPNPDYREATLEDIRNINPWEDMAGDTEWSKRLGPYCLTYSQEPGTARLIRANRPDLLAAFQSVLNTFRGLIWFHNWLYDWDNVEGMGLEFPVKRMRDSMVWVFELGNFQHQGLKVLGFRELGMEMQDFDDLVTPYSKPEVIEYFQMAQKLPWPKPTPFSYRDKNGEMKVKKPQSMNTKLKRFFTDLSKNPNKDPFVMWDDNWEDSQQMIEEKIGPYPGKDIAHVPYEQMLYYACRDADTLIRLVRIIKKISPIVRKLPQEKWREYGHI